MGNREANESKGHSVDFLLAEYRYLGDCFWRNEEIGERRVNFFITLATAAITALVTLVTTQQDNLGKDNVYFIAVFALLALLSFGIVTLLRMIHRNTVTDEYKGAMEMVRSRFRDWDEEQLQGYQPFEKGKPRKLGTGGLVDMVALVNSVIVAALCVLLAYFQLGLGIVLSGLLGFIAALIIQFIYVRCRYGKKGDTG
jgi:ABC-type transport system involved in cytochrome bd biosynthesis fused ATPase/permease subunit